MSLNGGLWALGRDPIVGSRAEFLVEGSKSVEERLKSVTRMFRGSLIMQHIYNTLYDFTTAFHQRRPYWRFMYVNVAKPVPDGEGLYALKY